MPLYRPCVAAILQDSLGRILVCERLGVAGAWQFPQGGVDPGETAEAALARELLEEISLPPADYWVAERKGPYRYLFGNGRRKRGFDGQEQTYFLLRATVPEPHIDLVTAHPEFQAMRWITPAEFDLNWLPGFKREVYQAVLRDFFGV